MIEPRMKRSLVLAAAGAFFASAFTGCSTVSTNGSVKTNILGGLATYEQNSYAPVKPVSLTVRSADVSPSRNVSGTQTSLLWGLITYSDY